MATQKIDTRAELVAEGVYSLNETAKMLDVTVRTVYELMHNGAIPWVKVGRLRKIPKVALRRYLESNLHSTTAVN